MFEIPPMSSKIGDGLWSYGLWLWVYPIFRERVSFILVRTIEDTSSGAMILSSPLTCRVRCNLSVAVKVKDTLRLCTWVEWRNICTFYLTRILIQTLYLACTWCILAFYLTYLLVSILFDTNSDTYSDMYSHIQISMWHSIWRVGNRVIFKMMYCTESLNIFLAYSLNWSWTDLPIVGTLVISGPSGPNPAFTLIIGLLALSTIS